MRRLPRAFKRVDATPALVATALSLGPAILLAHLAGRAEWVLAALAPLTLMVVCKAILEMQIPELAGYREQIDRKAWPQAAFYLSKAIARLDGKPYLSRLHILRPPSTQSDLRAHLRSEIAALKLLAGEPMEAERQLRRLIDEGKGEGFTFHNLAVLLFERGEPEEARPYVFTARALGVAPPFRSSPFSRRGIRREAHLNWLAEVGNMYQGVGLHELALECFRASSSPEKWLKSVQSLMNLGRTDEALKIALEATTLEPDSAVNWLALGMAHFKEQRCREATRCLARASTLDEKSARIKMVDYDIRMSSGGEKELLDLRSYLEEHERDPIVRGVVEAGIHSRLGRWMECLNSIQKVLECSEQKRVLKVMEINVRLLECWGHAFANLGMNEIGIQTLKKFCRLSEYADSLIVHGEARKQAALEVLERLGVA